MEREKSWKEIFTMIKKDLLGNTPKEKDILDGIEKINKPSNSSKKQIKSCDTDENDEDDFLIFHT